MSSKTQEITVTVLNQTVKSIDKNCALTGLQPGEIFDRLMLKFSPHEPELAALNILETISTSLHELDEDQINTTMRTVFAVLHRFITVDGLSGLSEMIDRLEELFPELDHEILPGFLPTDE